MVTNESRQQAIEITKNFCEAVALGTNTEVDFYRMLWIIHWAVELFGIQRTRETIEEMMLAKDFEPQRAPELLRDALQAQQTPTDSLGQWFMKAMAAH